eukprot:SAG11_NODE_23434_length_388_cov_1.882353_1_plen_73_part_00
MPCAALEKGDFIGEYTGEILTSEEAEAETRKESEYIFELGGGKHASYTSQLWLCSYGFAVMASQCAGIAVAP